MSEHFALMVPGASADGEPATVNAPFDNQEIATVERGGQQAAEQAMVTAHALYRNRDGWLSPARRIEILKTIADLLHRQREFLATGTINAKCSLISKTGKSEGQDLK